MATHQKTTRPILGGCLFLTPLLLRLLVLVLVTAMTSRPSMTNAFPVMVGSSSRRGPRRSPFLHQSASASASAAGYNNGHEQYGRLCSAFTATRLVVRMNQTSRGGGREPDKTTKKKNIKNNKNMIINKNKGGNRTNKNAKDDTEKTASSSSSPPPAGNFVVLPLVAIVGADLLVNIFFLTKRTLEALVLGHAPSTDTWW